MPSGAKRCRALEQERRSLEERTDRDREGTRQYYVGTAEPLELEWDENLDTAVDAMETALQMMRIDVPEPEDEREQDEREQEFARLIATVHSQITLSVREERLRRGLPAQPRPILPSATFVEDARLTIRRQNSRETRRGPPSGSDDDDRELAPPRAAATQPVPPRTEGRP